ncbi:hypothetical protein LC612_39955 [Nostoc sp. CHAB 5834]|nr:hypothetical protein [Nostoc sp. CHAB 5834]
MQDKTISFTNFRQGAVAEFDLDLKLTPPFKARVRSISVQGPRDYVVNLEPLLPDDTLTFEMVNVTHATRIVQHGLGNLVFENRSNMHAQVMVDQFEEAVQQGMVSRRGNRLVISSPWRPTWGLVRPWLFQVISSGPYAQKLQPWELFDDDMLLKDLLKLGMVKLHTTPGDYIARTAEVNVARAKKHIRQNFNRYKLNLAKAEKAEQEAEAESYKQMSSNEF